MFQGLPNLFHFAKLIKLFYNYHFIIYRITYRKTIITIVT